jgi:ectoine hydroxylase-related dioxygenase (phytanoyl-CoA dioxygenase family)
MSFNPPERPGHPFQGPRLHWDTSLLPPIPLGLQGLLYLTDTTADQGAFACVPGFHHRIEAWLKSLPPGANPRAQDLENLGAKPIAAEAGDLIIWHQALPHGSSPNRANRPRMVHYLTMFPAIAEPDRAWL